LEREAEQFAVEFEVREETMTTEEARDVRELFRLLYHSQE
jgi:hypothetical protein